MAILQIALVVASLFAPIAGLAADPSPPPDSTTVAPEPSDQPTPDPSTEPSPVPTVEPTPEPTAEPTPDATPAPTSEITPPPEPTTAATPSEDPSVAPSDTSATPSVAPSAAPSQSTGATVDYVVTFAAGADAATRALVLDAAGADIVDSIAPLRMAVIRVPDGSPIVAELRADPSISRVEVDRVRDAEARPDDRAYRSQWSLPRIGWDTVYGSLRPTGSAVVAVLDTGVDAGHADLGGQLVTGTSMVPGTSSTHDPNGHGTAMAGIIAAATDNGRGIAGIGYAGVKVMPVTVLDADGLGQDSDIIEGIVWAVDHGADVLNLSFSNPGYSSALQAAIDYAWAHDVVVVAATGNDGTSAPTYPAGDRGVIGVSNTDRNDSMNPSSNHGLDTFLAAPGTGIATLRVGGGTTTVTGTSASSAEVAGAAALLRALDPDASNGVIVGRLARTAAAVGSRAETGNGRLDLGQAAHDTGMDPVRPVGAPSGIGGPFVGPYVAAAATVQATTTLDGSTGTINVAPGASITLDMRVTTTGSGTADDWNSSRWAFGTTAPAAGSMTCVDHGNHSGVATYLETFSITAPASSGNYNLYLYAYNGDACASGQGARFTRTLALDNLAPSATPDLRAASDSGSSNSDNITNAANLTFAVAFSETVNGLAATDFSVLGTATGCVVGAPGSGPASYTVTLTGCSDGTVTLRLEADAVTDAGGNTNAQSDGPEVTVDRTVPTVTLLDLQDASDSGTSNTDDVTNATTLVFDLIFSEPVTGLAAGDFTEPGSATGCVFAPSGSGTTYTVTLTGCSNGTVIVRLAANAVRDTAGNGNALTNGPTITVDRTSPTVTINQAVGQVDPTGTSPITFTVVFNEAVTGFATGDVTIGGTSGGTKTGTVSGGPTTYSVAVTGMTTSGTVVATVAAGVATDAAGNSSVASSSTDNTVTWDSVAPSVTIDLNAASDSGVSNTDNLTNAANLAFTLTFSESVTGVTAADLTTTGSTATGCVIGNPTGSGATRSVTLTGCSNGSVVLTFLANGASDLAGNTGPASDVSLTVTVDRIAPTVTINQALGQVDPTNVSPIAFTVVFSETVAGFITGDVAVGGTSGGTKTGTVSGGPITFDVAVTGMTTSGTVVATIAASRATDLAGNNNTASTSTDNSVAWDRATHVAFVQQPTDTVYGSTIAPAVTVAILDASDQVVTETSKSVTLTLAPSGPSLGGTLTVATVNGVATFPDLTVDAVGTYTLDATSFGLTGATSASFDITPAPLTITADDRIKTYGQTVVFAGTEFTSSGLLNADTVTSVTLTSPGAVDTATVAGSPYPITPSAAIGGGLTNYAVTYVPGSLTVDRADPTIAVTGYSVTYDASPHSATGTATGAFGEDLSADLDLSATTHTAVGSYTDPWTFTDSTGNYNDDAGTVDSEITPAPLTVTADDQSKPFGVPFTFAGTEFTTSGLFGADTVDSATLTSAGTAAAAAPGSYPISISGAVGVGLANYAITYVDGTLTVGNTTPVVGDADVTTRATASVAGTVSVTDPDTGQTVTLSIISGPAHGSATVAADGSFMYTPTGSYTGDDTFTIEGCDDDPTPACDTGTVTVAVYPVAVDDDATVTTEGATIEVDVQANDVGDAGPVTIVSGPAYGTARVGSIIYTPDAGFSGTDQVVYRICSPNDPALCDDGTLSITVTGAAPETDTEVPIAVTLDDIARDPLPPLVMLLLTIAAIVAAGAVAKRSRSAGR